MKQHTEESGQETTSKTKEQLDCPLCGSPLVREAVEAGKCQCCGHRFDPNELKKSGTTSK